MFLIINNMVTYIFKDFKFSQSKGNDHITFREKRWVFFFEEKKTYFISPNFMGGGGWGLN